IAMLKGTGVNVRKVRRLEMLYESCIESSESFADAEAKIVAGLTDMKKKGIYGLKSVIAYRTGMNIQPTKRWAAMDDFARLKRDQAASKTGKIRIAYKNIEDYLTCVAFAMAGEQNVPVQFHSGIGDTDEDMYLANPLQLRTVLEDPAFARTTFVPLHVFPHVQDTAYLAHVYGNVYFDLSYAIPLTHGAAAGLIEDALTIAPYSKLLYGTDAPGLPDLWYTGGIVWRRALSRVLTGWVQEGALTQKLADDVAERVLYKNAAGLYDIKV
ncbi:MAG: amidohydrolase, partial [SAR202 cluster bacterium]|nr:amidohydrolase [SAR202 cluster bacterium]